MRLCVFAEERGEVIPVVLPSLATQLILQGEVTCRGIVPLYDWLPFPRFAKELKRPQAKMAVQTDETGIWLPRN